MKIKKFFPVLILMLLFSMLTVSAQTRNVILDDATSRPLGVSGVYTYSLNETVIFRNNLVIVNFSLSQSGNSDGGIHVTDSSGNDIARVRLNDEAGIGSDVIQQPDACDAFNFNDALCGSGCGVPNGFNQANVSFFWKSATALGVTVNGVTPSIDIRLCSNNSFDNLSIENQGAGTATFFDTIVTAINTTNVAPSFTTPITTNTGDTNATVGSSLYYLITATDPESDSIYNSVNCEVGTDTVGAWSSADAVDTSHDTCTYSTVGCKNAVVFLTDNQENRTFGADHDSGIFPESEINISINYYCGDSQCNPSETYVSCPSDCSISTCGDIVCQATETSLSCPIDCSGGTCGNAVCETDENFVSCPADCTISTCGDGIPQCDPSVGTVETTSNCPFDLLALGTCGDSICATTETFATCPADCTLLTCGDGTCGGGEDFTSCPADCGNCGNGVCEESLGETATNCAIDCAELSTLTLPSELVDINDPTLQTGLIPELYFGIRAFLSNSLVPIIYLMVMLMVAGLFILVSTFMRKLAGKT